ICNLALLITNRVSLKTLNRLNLMASLLAFWAWFGANLMTGPSNPYGFSSAVYAVALVILMHLAFLALPWTAKTESP
ncbi:MAG: hypothetical protein AAF492_11000, partial [Verrucomicrobiota bacterium]